MELNIVDIYFYDLYTYTDQYYFILEYEYEDTHLLHFYVTVKNYNNDVLIEIEIYIYNHFSYNNQDYMMNDAISLINISINNIYIVYKNNIRSLDE